MHGRVELAERVRGRAVWPWSGPRSVDAVNGWNWRTRLHATRSERARRSPPCPARSPQLRTSSIPAVGSVVLAIWLVRAPHRLRYTHLRRS